jgi:hypothetical protein
VRELQHADAVRRSFGSGSRAAPPASEPEFKKKGRCKARPSSSPQSIWEYYNRGRFRCICGGARSGVGLNTKQGKVQVTSGKRIFYVEPGPHGAIFEETSDGVLVPVRDLTPEREERLRRLAKTRKSPPAR